ncbi:MAG TPA: RidA family protein [Thermodesulfovibrionales bacterium]|nr:RidA family protein [Thermodesulfovibrionales bacterium]
MVSPEERLKELGIELPGTPAPLGAYVPCVRSGNLLFLSGMLPLRKGKLTRTGRVGEGVSLGDAQEDARQVVINALSIMKAELGTLEKVVRCVKVTGFIASAADFVQQPAVLNAASELLLTIFGDRGRHARAAVGVPVLPLNSPLEVEFIFEVTEKETA